MLMLLRLHKNIPRRKSNHFLWSLAFFKTDLANLNSDLSFVFSKIPQFNPSMQKVKLRHLTSANRDR